MIFPQPLAQPGGAIIAAADLLLLVALVAWLCRYAVGSNERVLLGRNPVLVPSLLFAGATAASLAWTSQTGATMKAVVQTVEIVVVLPLVFASVPRSIDRLRLALARFVAITVGLSLLVFAYALPRLATGHFEAQYLPWLHKTAAGGFIGVGLVVAFAFSLDRGRPLPSRRLYAAAVLAEILGLLATVSRGAIAGALCGALVVSLVMHRSRLRTVILVGLGAVAFVIGVQTQLNARVAATGGAFNTNDVRLLSYAHGVEKIKEHPVLGTGAGTYWDHIAELNIGLADPNNIFLLTWAEVGLAGMAALLFLLWRYGRLVVAARRLPEHARVVTLAAGGAAFSMFAHFQVDSTWTRGTASICFAMVGLVVAGTRLGRGPTAVAAVAAGGEIVRAPATEPEDRRLGVLHIVSGTGFAGIERHVLRLARGLAQRDVDVTIACPPTAQRLREEAADAGIRVIPPATAPRTAWMSDLGRWIPGTPRIVHVHDGLAAVAGWRLAAQRGARLVRSQHFVRPASAERSGWRRVASFALHRTLNADVDALVAVSQSAADAALERNEVAGSKISVIPPGIELAQPKDVDRAVERRRTLPHPVVAYIGRLEREKAIPLLLMSIPLVLEHAPSTRFVIAGSGAAEPELRALARSLKIGRSVRWLGEIPHPATVLSDAHAFVNPSASEGFGLAVAEAMSWALPVVGRTTGGVAEIVDHGKTGLLVAEDDPAELAAAIVQLVENRKLAEKLGREAQRVAAAQFGSERTADLTLQLYERLR
jgi:glycogen(starch) synthase